mmetsp:Transcript_82406/g.229587  ORF Transcript_82406/g.229587 Transcript_82406/m.229587 type:complete len:439 (-) Transcript_82406:170-1486(-)
MDLQSNPVNEILYVSFNQDSTCFVCGTETGFRVYSVDPFRLTHRREFEDGGGLGVVAMLFRTNILAFSGGGASPRFQPHKVMLWDDKTARVVAELSFRSVVRSVRLRRDLVVVVLDRKIYVYGLRSLHLLNSIETISNPKGLCCLSVGADRVMLVCPGMQQGRVLVVFYPRSFGEFQAPTDRERTIIIAAHEAPLAAMGIDYSGALLATASEKGTIVRVFDTTKGAPIQELRRGLDRAEIHSLAFGPVFGQAGEWLAVASDKGTVHIFSVRRLGRDGYGGGNASSSAAHAAHHTGADSSTPGNSKSSLQRISRVLPSYFSSEWSLAQFRVPDNRCISAFGTDPRTIIILCANGSYYKARFDPVRGGEMVREEFATFDDASSPLHEGGETSSASAPTVLLKSAAPMAATPAAASDADAAAQEMTQLQDGFADASIQDDL